MKTLNSVHNDYNNDQVSRILLIQFWKYLPSQVVTSKNNNVVHDLRWSLNNAWDTETDTKRFTEFLTESIF